MVRCAMEEGGTVKRENRREGRVWEGQQRERGEGGRDCRGAEYVRVMREEPPA